MLHQECAERRAGHRGDAEYRGDQPLHARPFGGRIDVAADRHGDRLHAAGAQALQCAEQHQPDHAGGEAAQRRADQEKPSAGVEHLLAAIDVGQAAIDRNADGLAQQIDREHPTEQAEPAQLGNDGRHGGGDDGALYRRHERGHDAGCQDQRAARRDMRRSDGVGGYVLAAGRGRPEGRAVGRHCALFPSAARHDNRVSRDPALPAAPAGGPRRYPRRSGARLRRFHRAAGLAPGAEAALDMCNVLESHVLRGLGSQG